MSFFEVLKLWHWHKSRILTQGETEELLAQTIALSEENEQENDEEELLRQAIAFSLVYWKWSMIVLLVFLSTTTTWHCQYTSKSINLTCYRVVPNNCKSLPSFYWWIHLLTLSHQHSATLLHVSNHPAIPYSDNLKWNSQMNYKIIVVHSATSTSYATTQRNILRRRIVAQTLRLLAHTWQFFEVFPCFGRRWWIA